MAERGRKLSGLKVLFVSSTDYSHRTREFREAISLLDAGADVHLIGYAQTIPKVWRNSQIIVHEFHPRPCPPIASQNKVWALRVIMNLTINIVRRVFRKYVFLKRDHKKFVNEGTLINPNVVHAMDLPSLKEAALIANKCNAELVYDSSEYWRGFLQNKVWDKSGAEKRKYLRIEKKYIQDASLVLTTSSLMSKRLKSDYDFEAPVIHLYNSPICSGKYPSPQPVKDNLKVVFHGGVSPDRNLEGLLVALSLAPATITLDVYGSFVLGMQKVCEEIVSELELANRVTFHGAFAYGTMLDFLPQYDIGFYPAVASDGNFDVTLPNKVFDCICAGLAVVTPPFKSIEELLSEIGNGLVADTTSPESMAETLSILNDDWAHVDSFKKKSCLVAPQYAWEAQGEKLVEAYGKFFITARRLEHETS